MNTPEEIASKNLADNLHKIVKLALINYPKQSAFYRHCNTQRVHVERFVQHFYKGFLKEAKFQGYTAIVKTPNNPTFSLTPTVRVKLA